MVSIREIVYLLMVLFCLCRINVCKSQEGRNDIKELASNGTTSVMKGRQSVINSLSTVLSDIGQAFDIRLPFINIPYSFFSNLWSATQNTDLSSSSMLSLNLVSFTLLSGLSFLLYILSPKIVENFGSLNNIVGFRSFSDLGFGSMDELFGKVNNALNKFEIDSDVCMKMALCTLGKAKTTPSQAKGQKSFTTLDFINGVLNLSVMRDLPVFSKRGYRNARDYGESGGDCSTYNREKKCPLNDETWNLLLSSINSSIY